MMVIWSGCTSNLGAILSRSVVIVASIAVWLCGIEDAILVACAVEYLLAVLMQRLGARKIFLVAILGAWVLIKPRIIIMRSEDVNGQLTSRACPEDLMALESAGIEALALN